MAKAARNPVNGLTLKEDEFCFQTVRIGDANKAYRLSYSAAGMAQASVRKEVSRMLNKPAIMDRLRELQLIADRKLEVSIERIAKELACIGFARLSDLFDDDGNPIPAHLLPEHIDRAVQSITIVERRMVMPVKVEVDKNGVAREVFAGKTRAEKHVAKATAKLKDKDDSESTTSITFVPLREKKLVLHDKHPALQTMARWKKMITDKVEAVDPTDPAQLSDEELEAQIRADEAMLKTVAEARERARKIVKRAGAKQAAG